MAINIITKEFSYNVPDEYLLNTNANGEQHTLSYTGPDAIYIAVNKSTGKVEWASGFEAVDGTGDDLTLMNQRASADAKVIKVIAEDTPVICWLALSPDVDRDAGPQKEYKLVGDDTVYYSRPATIYPDHCYEEEDITYNLNTDTWNTFPWKGPHMNWENLLGAATAIAASRQHDIDNGVITDADEITASESYITEMQGIEAKFKGASWADGSLVQPWQVPFPADPMAPPPPEGEAP